MMDDREADDFRERLRGTNKERDKPLPPREPVMWFAERMERKLTNHDHDYGYCGWLSSKESWTKDYKKFLFQKMLEEVGELAYTSDQDDPEQFIDEAADIANFAMMLADNVRRLYVEGKTDSD